jgi:hypothetical protein
MCGIVAIQNRILPPDLEEGRNSEQDQAQPKEKDWSERSQERGNRARIFFGHTT